MADESHNPLLPTAYDIVWSGMWIAAVLLMVLALVSLTRHAKRLTGWQALGWTLLTIFVPLVGPLTWLFIGRRARVSRPGS